MYHVPQYLVYVRATYTWSVFRNFIPCYMYTPRYLSITIPIPRIKALKTGKTPDVYNIRSRPFVFVLLLGYNAAYKYRLKASFPLCEAGYPHL